MSVPRRILALLEEHEGVFEAPKGNAGPLIAARLGAKENTVQAALYRLERDNAILRETVGKRTYKVMLRDVETERTSRVERIPDHFSFSPEGPVADGGEIDYDRLAAHLLRRVLIVTREHDDLVERSKEDRLRIEEMERQLRLLDEDLSRTRGVLRRAQEELAKPRRGRSPFRETLTDEERAVLDRLFPPRGKR